MNALVPHASQGASALIPRDMREAMQLADMMAKAGFLARELQNPGGALFVIEQSMRWNMSPFAVAMETSFIQGKPMFSGKIVAAAVTSSGAITGPLDYEYEGEGDNRQITVIGHRRGEAEPRTVTVRLKDARTANKVWTTQPDQQLSYHGARVWARRWTPAVMLGVLSPEEMEEAPREPMPPARGPTIDAAEQFARPPAAPPWQGLSWPICDRRGGCVDMAEPDLWLEEVQRRVAHIQGLTTLDDAMKKRTIQQIVDANAGAWDALRGAGYDSHVDEAEALIRAALGIVEGEGEG